MATGGVFMCKNTCSQNLRGRKVSVLLRAQRGMMMGAAGCFKRSLIPKLSKLLIFFIPDELRVITDFQIKTSKITYDIFFYRETR